MKVVGYLLDVACEPQAFCEAAVFAEVDFAEVCELVFALFCVEDVLTAFAVDLPLTLRVLVCVAFCVFFVAIFTFSFATGFVTRIVCRGRRSLYGFLRIFIQKIAFHVVALRDGKRVRFHVV